MTGWNTIRASLRHNTLCNRRWRDGQYGSIELEGLDRWEVQAADVVEVSVGSVVLSVQQKVRASAKPFVARNVQQTSDWHLVWTTSNQRQVHNDQNRENMYVCLQPRDIGADKLSVGAACWDGAWVMLAYLCASHPHRHVRKSHCGYT